jgi:ribosome-associated protein
VTDRFTEAYNNKKERVYTNNTVVRPRAFLTGKNPAAAGAFHKRRRTDMGDTRTKKMASLAWHALEDKKAENITVIDIAEVSVLADYFIIASGKNKAQVQAMADNVEEILGKAGYELKQAEGYQTANWILLDYGDIVVHLFDTENRLFYDLERIWRDGKVTSIADLDL